jgi:hypothetical protein
MKTAKMYRLMFLELSIVAALFAQKPAPIPAPQAQPPSPDKDRVSGIVQDVTVSANKDATITIESGSGRIPHKVLVTPATHIADQKGPSTLAEVKKGRTLDCIGGNHGDLFVARSCSVK